jgi:hypothetical protein
LPPDTKNRGLLIKVKIFRLLAITALLSTVTVFAGTISEVSSGSLQTITRAVVRNPTVTEMGQNLGLVAVTGSDTQADAATMMQRLYSAGSFGFALGTTATNAKQSLTVGADAAYSDS